MAVAVALMAVAAVGPVPALGSEVRPVTVPAAATAPAGTTSGFVPVVPRRLVDTRVALGAPLGPVAADGVLSVDPPADLPADALGIALTVTADLGADPGYLTAYACGGGRPLASVLNPERGEARANQVLLPLDSTRRSCIYTKTTVHVIVDVTGWSVPGGQPFRSLTPVRVLDTRSGPRPDGGSGRPGPGEVIELPIAAAAGNAAAVPGDTVAVAANITVTDAVGPGHVTAYPCGASRPGTSTGNFPAGQSRAASALVGLGSTGSLCLSVNTSAHLVVDLNGWFGPGGDEAVQPWTPRRVLDTRADPDGAVTDGESRVLLTGLPPGVTMAALNLTATDGDADGWVRVAPCGADPGTSSVNYDAGQTIANLAVTSVAGEESVCLVSNVRTHLVVDLVAASSPGTVAEFAVDGFDLQPPFRIDITDYVARCNWGSNAVGVHAAAEPGATVSLDGAPASTAGSAVVVLQPGQGFPVSFSRGGVTTTYRIRCLPPDFPRFVAKRSMTTESGWYLTTPTGDSTGSYVVVHDHEGVPVWWYKDVDGPEDARLVDPQHITWNRSQGWAWGRNPANEYTVRRLDGTATDHIKADGAVTDYHDVSVLPGGDRLVSTYEERQGVDLTAIGLGSSERVVESHLQVVSPAGVAVWDWRSRDHLAVTETTRPYQFRLPDGGLLYDLIHVNSVWADGDGFIVSARHLDAVFRIDRATGNLTWKLGGVPHANSPGVRNLAFLGDPVGYFGGQHDARLLADGTLTVHDNQTFSGRVRAARYRLDLGAGTATLLEQIVDPEVLGSAFIGSARRTSAGTWVINWGGSPLVTETDASGRRLFTLRWDSTYSYRTAVVEPGGVSRDALSAGMDARFPRA